ncbi:lipopolysaccharide biosynthesis protein [Phocaeicola sp.]
MVAFLIKIAKILGVDKSIAYSSGARVIQAFTGVASIFFISRYLTGVEQGFYYTFGSIVAIQVFFELGLTNIITQYVAHEASHLGWNGSFVLEGEHKYKSRLASLLQFSVRWYAVVSILFFVVLLVAGNIFFSSFTHNEDNVSWQIPWILICIGTIVNLFLQPILAILMGLDKVKEVSKIRFYQQVILPISSWVGLIVGFKLYVVGISSLLTALLVCVYVYGTNFKVILYNLWNIEVVEKVSYMQEIFPFQWRIALSALSGYFIFSFLNPILFAFQGAVVAGQMGMTLTILNAVQAFSMSWLNTKVPLYSRLIALKKYSELDKLFKITMNQMLSICVFLMTMMIACVSLIEYFKISINNELLCNRFLKGETLIFLVIAYLVDQFTFSWATYLRCHKKEPYLWISIFTGIGCCISTYFSSKYLSVWGVSFCYCLVKITSIPWGYAIFRKYKLLWHN